jgi:hypothetical protein
MSSCSPNIHRAILALLAVLATLFGSKAVWADRATAPRVLPKSTLAFVRIADTPQLVSRFRETSLGRISQDEQVKPLVSGVYAAAEEAWTQIEDRVGLPLNQLLAIPQGEISVAFVGQTKNEEGKYVGPSGVVLLIDVKDRIADANKLLDKGAQFMEENGGRRETEMVDGVELTKYSGPDGNSAYLFVREGTIVVSTNKELAVGVHTSWSGAADGESLADNDKFASIMSRCSGSVDDPPQVTWFVDAIDLIRALARGNTAAQTGLALFPVLGLDGIKGVGGSWTFATGDFDGIMHMHVLLESPRSGVVEMLALGSGDVTPEAWVPADASSYITLHWDVDETFGVAARLYNSLMNEGAFEAEVQRRLSERIGADFEKEILPLLDGRVTMMNWVDRDGPPRLNSQTTVVGVKVTDSEAFRPIHDKIVEKFAERLEKKSFAGTEYHMIKQGEPNEALNNARRPEPCLAIVGDYLLIADSTLALEHAIKTANTPNGSLASDVEFKLIASRIKRQIGGDKPGMLQFTKPEEGMRLLYDLAAADTTRQQVSSQADSNKFFKKLDETMKDNPLPPFSVLARYLAPGGGMVTSDETGFHYTSFTLRRK